MANDPITINTHTMVHPQTHRFASSTTTTTTTTTTKENHSSSSSSSSPYFLWLSDIHFDPNYSTPSAYRYPDGRYDASANCTSSNASIIKATGMHGCDAPLALFQSTLEAVSAYISSQSTAASAQRQPPEFILITGDVVRHGTTNYESAYQILYTVASELTTKFPNVEIIYSVGNNDVVPDYYLRLPSDSEQVGSEDGEGSDEASTTTTTADTTNDIGMLEVIFNSLFGQSSDNNLTITTTTSIASTRQTKSILSPDDRNTFLTGGYYSRYLHSDNSLLVLSINTVLYSAILEPPRNSDDADPGMQFSWMRAMLASCRNSNDGNNSSENTSSGGGGGCRAIIAGHIPPSVGSYKFNQLWKEEYIRT